MSERIKYTMVFPVHIEAEDKTLLREIKTIEFPEFPRAEFIMGIRQGEMGTPASTAKVLEMIAGIPAAVISKKFHSADLMLLGGVVNSFLWGSASPEALSAQAEVTSTTT